MTEGTRQRLSRRAKLQGVDYAVLASGQQIPEYSSSSESSGDDETYGGSSKKLKRRKRTTNTSSGISISSSHPGSAQDNDALGTSAAVKRKCRRKRKANALPSDCFICARESKSPFMQCEICARWYHYRCWKPFESASVLGNTSCHECVQGRTPTLKRAPAATAADGSATGDSVAAVAAPLQKPPLATLRDFVTLLRKAKKILVVAGAGMSVSCGIPDFRSKDGIYAMIEHMDTHLPEPECVFQIEYFRQDPAPFFELVRNVFAHAPAPSKTHRFLKLLQDKKKLLRLYSQNIDGLEEAAGVTKYIPCHGSFAWSRCMRCKHRVPTSSIMGVVRAGVIPTCSQAACHGVLKPEITFFGELLSDHVSTSVTKDRLQADLLLVIGTSLKVSPVAEIPGFLPSHIPQVVINKTALKKKALKSNGKSGRGSGDGGDGSAANEFDLTLLGDCDAIIEHLCDFAQWELPAAAHDSTGASASYAHEHPRLRVIQHANKPKVLCFGECHCANTLDDRHNNNGDDDDDTGAAPSGFVCDGCGKDFGVQASTQGHYSCDECFDFDLCGVCYPTKARAHFAGAHHFSRA